MGARRHRHTAVPYPLLRIHEAAKRLVCEPATLWALLHKGAPRLAACHHSRCLVNHYAAPIVHGDMEEWRGAAKV